MKKKPTLRRGFLLRVKYSGVMRVLKDGHSAEAKFWWGRDWNKSVFRAALFDTRAEADQFVIQQRLLQTSSSMWDDAVPVECDLSMIGGRVDQLVKEIA